MNPGMPSFLYDSGFLVRYTRPIYSPMILPTTEVHQ